MTILSPYIPCLYWFYFWAVTTYHFHHHIFLLHNATQPACFVPTLKFFEWVRFSRENMMWVSKKFSTFSSIKMLLFAIFMCFFMGVRAQVTHPDEGNLFFVPFCSFIVLFYCFLEYVLFVICLFFSLGWWSLIGYGKYKRSNFMQTVKPK